MATQTFTRLYNNHNDAAHIVQMLEEAGIGRGSNQSHTQNEISLYR